MMTLQRAAVIAVLLLATLAAGASAADPAPVTPRDFLGHPPAGAPGVEVQAWFPNNLRKQFPLGETVDVVIGFSNGGEETYNVTGVQGSLHSAAAWNLWVQNFTAQAVSLSLKPGEQASMRYDFKPDAMLHPREFLVALHVFYQGLTAPHHNLAFNQTVDIIEKPKLIDFQLLGLYGIVAALLAAVGYLVYQQLKGVGWVRAATKRRAPRQASGVDNSADPSQWLKGTFYDSHARQKAKRQASTEVKKGA